MKRFKYLIMCIIILLSLVIGVFTRPIKYNRYTYTTEELNEVSKLLLSEYDTTVLTLSKNEYKKLIEDDWNFKYYLYFEKDLKDGYSGWAGVGIATIVCDIDLDGLEYPITFAHEVLHFRKFSCNETYISFETFKYLYYNKNPHLRNVGIWFGLIQLSGGYNGDYDIKELIIEEMRKNEKI